MQLPLIDPVLPVLAKELPRGSEWRFEVKLDGFRGVLYVESGAAFFRSKNNLRMRRFQALADRLAEVLPVRSAILDGEIVVVSEGAVDFYGLMFQRGQPQYAAFDLLWLNGRELRGWRYSRRKERLRKLLDGTGIAFVDSYAERELFEATVRLDMEGVVAKRMGDVYGPETRWVKVKHPHYSQAEGRADLFDRKRR